MNDIETRVAQLEDLCRLTLGLMSGMTEKLIYFGEKTVDARENSYLVLDLVLHINPKLRTDELTGLIHHNKTQIEFDRENFKKFAGELEAMNKLLRGAFPPPPPPAAPLP